MSEQMNEREVFTLIDEENGEELEFEKIGEVMYGENVYFAMIPTTKEATEDGFYEYTVLRLDTDENGEHTLVTVDDDEEFDNVADLFDDMFSEEIDYDGK